jgi:hypothetical protein
MLILNIDLNVNTFVSMIVALHFAAFGWRINREIAVGDAGRRTWFPIPHSINIMSMLCVVVFCMMIPLSTGHFNKGTQAVTR